MTATVRDIKRLVAAHFAVPEAVMTGPRLDPLSDKHMARQTAMFFARELANKSYFDIATRFGRRDHTTARHAYLKIQRLRAENDEFAEEIAALERKIVSAVDKRHQEPFCAASEAA
jgi:chromosomal replication initiator protein